MLLGLIGMAAAKPDSDLCWVKGNGVGYAGQTAVMFVGRAEMERQERARATAELREPRPVVEAGTVLVDVRRQTIDATRGELHTVVVFGADGTELARVDGSGVPDLPSGLYKFWSTTIVAPVPGPAVFPLRVAAADKVLAKRCEWTVAADGAIAGVRVDQ